MRRELPGGIGQRWRTPEDRERDRQRENEQERGRLHRAHPVGSDKPEAHAGEGSAPGRAGLDGKPWSAVPTHRALGSLRDSALLQTLLAAVLLLVLGALAIVSISGAESAQSSAEAAGSSSDPPEGELRDAFSLSGLEGSTWGEARDVMEERSGGGAISVLEHGTGLPLTFAYGGDPQRDEWTVCTAELASGTFDEPGWLVTMEIASPHDGCPTGALESQATATDRYDDGSETAAPEARDSDSGRGVHPGSWCGDPGAYGYTGAGTRMQCRYGAGNDYRWRRAG
ncbi:MULTISPECIES: hypothetical protein [Streptomyces]|uniref:hypothetical protein n=1 Tax=Streptomyces TaxID=1883 RepID=UPI00403CF2CA